MFYDFMNLSNKTEKYAWTSTGTCGNVTVSDTAMLEMISDHLNQYGAEGVLWFREAVVSCASTEEEHTFKQRWRLWLLQSRFSL